MDLAVLREFLVGATEGWLLARASVRDLLARGSRPRSAGVTSRPTALAWGNAGEPPRGDGRGMG